MDPDVRSQMEGAFGEDFAEVRLHADPKAAAQASSMGARAFTRGQDIYFGPLGYRPLTPDGRHTLAHELAHVVQQRAQVAHGRGAQSARTTPSDGPHLDDESAADRAGAAAARSTAFRAPSGLSGVPGTASPAIQRQPEPGPAGGQFELPLIPPDWLRQANPRDLLVARLGERMVALPAQGAVTFVHPPVTTGPPGQPPPVPVLSLPTVGKESIKTRLSRRQRRVPH